MQAPGAPSPSPLSLRRPGTRPYISLRAPYAMSGTDLAYYVTAYARAMPCPVLTSRIPLRACYAMSGTDIAYCSARPPPLYAGTCAAACHVIRCEIKCLFLLSRYSVY
eukprot:3631895-Rhodomonas_salina.1